MNLLYRSLSKVSSGIILVSLLLSLSGCISAPDNVGKGFIRAIASGDAGKALDYVCINDSNGSGQTTFVFAIQMDWGQDYYKVLNQNDKETQLLVSGRAKITLDNLQNFAKTSPDLQQFINDSRIDLPRIGAGLQVGVNFNGFYLSYDNLRKRWCVENRSIAGLKDYLIQQIADALKTFFTN